MLSLTLACCSVLVAGDATDKIDKEALKKLQGRWQLITHEHGGERSEQKKIATITLQVTGEKFITRDGLESKEESSVEMIEAKNKPSTIDLKITSGSDADKTLRGIWKREGDTLSFCVAEPNRSRPERFAGAAGTGHTLLVFKPVKE